MSATRARFGARRIRQPLAAVVLAAVAALGQRVAAAEPPTEYQVKAAFLYNFAKFVQWPALPPAPPVVRLCLIGGNPFAAAIDTVAGQPVGNRTLEVVGLVSLDAIANCQILFIAAEVPGEVQRIIERTRDAPILTVADRSGLAARGVVINFYTQDRKVRFEINVDAAKRANVTISSYLLNLARIVREGMAQ